MDGEKNVCPLSLVDWLNYLTSEQNRERYHYYNEELSFLSNMIIVLTILLGLFAFLSIFNLFNLVPDFYKISFAVIAGIVFVAMISYSNKRDKYFQKQKDYMNARIDEEACIIEDILRGNDLDVQSIRKRYFDIWDKELWKNKIQTMNTEVKVDNQGKVISKVTREFGRAFELVIASLIGAFLGLYLNTLATSGNMNNQVAWGLIIAFMIIMAFVLVFINLLYDYLAERMKK